MKFLITILLTFSFNLKSDTNLNEHEDIIKKTLSNTMLSLKNSLEKALESGDVENAVKMCSLEAQDLTNKSNTRKTTIKRISLKYRNPKNKPTKFEETILQNFEKKLTSGAKFTDLEFKKVLSGKEFNTLLYIKAIPTKGVCLNCHGQNIDKDVQAEISSKYPNDNAIGFKLGDIRGAFSVRHNFNH